MTDILFIASSDKGIDLALDYIKEFPKADGYRPYLVSTRKHAEATQIPDIHTFLQSGFHNYQIIVFIGALGICVRQVAPFLHDKNTDPAIINCDENGTFVQPVAGNHKGNGNELAKKLAQIKGGTPVITTSSDVQQLWSLDTLHQSYNWTAESTAALTEIQGLFVNRHPFALFLEVRDDGTEYLEKSCPDFVSIVYSENQLKEVDCDAVIAVTWRYLQTDLPVLYYRPKVLHLGLGCEKNIPSDTFTDELIRNLHKLNISEKAVKSIASIQLKGEEPAFLHLQQNLDCGFITYPDEALSQVENIPNPSEYVQSEVNTPGVAEPAAMLASDNEQLFISKQKVTLQNVSSDEGQRFTMAIAIDKSLQREGIIKIVGAGPGDPDLITLRGKQAIEQADLVLYAGSLIPETLLKYTKPGATVRNSASMTLEGQFENMQHFYDQGKTVVRLHSGDPSIYGAIQEQMTWFDERGWNYIVEPGIGAAQAGAAILKSEFTIPEKVQTIIHTRGEGKTPTPPHEDISVMASLRSTMCIYLSARIIKKVQAQLLEHYPPETPVAVGYRLTWQDEELYTGTLQELAEIVREHKLTRTVLIFVGEALGARKNRSRLYHADWKHVFRTGKSGAGKISDNGWETAETEEGGSKR